MCKFSRISSSSPQQRSVRGGFDCGGSGVGDMASRLKEDEKNERTIRNLLKLPENRRCINCNSLYLNFLQWRLRGRKHMMHRVAKGEPDNEAWSILADYQQLNYGCP